MTEDIFQLFGTQKPVIAMDHVPELPGTPHYDAKKRMDFRVDHVQQDVDGYTWNPVDKDRVKRFIDEINKVR